MLAQIHGRRPSPAAVQALTLMVSLFLALPLSAQENGPALQSGTRSIIDRVIAVVNRQTILESDLQDELELSVLDPSASGQNTVTKQQALDRLISRTLIEQQIRQEDSQASGPDPKDITARIEEIRTELPACIRAECRKDAGWNSFLARHDLTPARVENYMRNRLEILSFIEMRFRQGIRISPEEIEQYYRETLLPQYPLSQQAPPLEQVSSRIEEILLQQKVNLLFENWLANLRSQGQIEVLDPSLEDSKPSKSEGATKE